MQPDMSGARLQPSICEQLQVLDAAELLPGEGLLLSEREGGSSNGSDDASIVLAFSPAAQEHAGLQGPADADAGALPAEPAHDETRYCT